jgi:hypothetical protein
MHCARLAPNGCPARVATLRASLSDAEDVGALTAQDATHQLAAMPRAFDDLLDWDALLRQFQDSLVYLLTTQISFILQPLSIGEKSRIYDGAADSLSDLAHGFVDRIEESAAGVFHEMPAVGHLIGVRQGLGDRLAIPATPITRDSRDGRMVREPCLRCRLLAIGQQCHRPAAFEIADNRPITLAAPECEVVNAADGGSLRGCSVLRRTTRSRVSLLTGIIRRSAKAAAGLPFNARPR